MCLVDSVDFHLMVGGGSNFRLYTWNIEFYSIQGVTFLIVGETEQQQKKLF